MIDTWTTHWTGTVGERTVETSTYSEGGYRVTTQTAKDYDGKSEADGSSIMIMPPIPAGSPVELDGDTFEELRRELVAEHFSEAEIEEIIGHFP